MGWGKYSEPINAIGQVADFVGSSLFGGWKRAAQHAIEHPEAGWRGALEKGFGGSKDDITSHIFNSGDLDNEMYLSVGKLAGGVAGLGIGYRFASGGGVYRDKNGNTDWAGVPFV